jgi:hypothetical protein
MCTLKKLLDEVSSQQSGCDATPLIVLDGKDDPTVTEKLKRRSTTASSAETEGNSSPHHALSVRGSIFVRTCTITHSPSFLDYVKSGAQVHCPSSHYDPLLVR